MPAQSTNAQAETSILELSFEEALAELEGVVRTLEAGSIPLEKSLELTQRGMRLATLCDTTLQRAESILDQLILSDEGELVVERLQWQGDDEQLTQHGDELS